MGGCCQSVQTGKKAHDYKKKSGDEQNKSEQIIERPIEKVRVPKPEEGTDEKEDRHGLTNKQKEEDKLTVLEYYKKMIIKHELEKIELEVQNQTTFDFAKILKAALKDTALAAIHNQLKDVKAANGTYEAPLFMKRIFEQNWSYTISKITTNGESSEDILLSDLDCLSINVKLMLLGNPRNQRPFVYLLNYIIDVENMVGFIGGQKTANAYLKVTRTKNNDRRRSRFSNRKGHGFDFTFNLANKLKDTFAEDVGEFGNRWHKKYNDGKRHEQGFPLPPTARQIITGIKQFFELLADKLTAGQKCKLRVTNIKKNLQIIFDQIQILYDFKDWDEPFKRDFSDQEYGLWCPSSKACFLVLWLYSIEPPLYAFLNKACRQMDEGLLPLLGAWAAALYRVLQHAERYRKDTPTAGWQLHWPGKKKDPLGWMAGSFIVFRGVSLQPTVIQRWTNMVEKSEFDHLKDINQRYKQDSWMKKKPHFIYVPGNTSTSESFRVALDFAKTKDPQNQMALFVMCVHNYRGFSGFRMNSLQYSAHPDEFEILFAEGIQVAVVGFEEIVFGDQEFTDPFMSYFNGKQLWLIFLFHTKG